MRIIAILILILLCIALLPEIQFHADSMKIARPEYINVGDSSTVVVRGVGAMLRGEEFDPFLVPTYQRIAGTIVNKFPKSWRKFIMESLTSRLCADMQDAAKVRSDDLAGWVVSEYPKRQYDAIIIGSPSGGVSHLASLLQAPFLTQHFLLGFKGKYPIDNSKLYLDKCKVAADTIIENNDDLAAIIHYDPLHDRFLVKQTGFVRLKLLKLHDKYREFIQTNLKPGGSIILIGCKYPWLQYRITDRINFQLGGLGGVTPQEYYDGSDRISEYINRETLFFERIGSAHSHDGWLIDGYDLVECPESEWGLLPSFADEVKDFAKENNYRLINLNLDHPDQLSEIVFNAYGDLIAREYPDAPKRIFLDSFTNSSPAFNRKVSAQPLWLPFICDDSFDFATRILDKQTDDTEILLALHPSFSDPFDLTPLEKWQNYLSRFKSVTLIGVDADAYPADITSYFKFGDDVKKYASEYPLLLKGIMKADELTRYESSEKWPY